MTRWVLVSFFLLLFQGAFSQAILDSTGRSIPVDSINKIAQPLNSKKIDSVLKVHSPHKAIIRSAIIPGWGQIYNKKYWKLPIVYGALGAAGGIFVYNLNWYKKTRFAYKVVVTHDTANYSKIDPQLQPFVTNGDAASLQYNRNQFRKNVDYSALFFLALWGLNVVDAAVDAHLKSFDVSPDLSLQLKPGYSEMAGTKGLSLVLAFK